MVEDAVKDLRHLIVWRRTFRGAECEERGVPGAAGGVQAMPACTAGNLDLDRLTPRCCEWLHKPRG